MASFTTGCFRSVSASMHHVPPGTRVCTAWSEQLGVNLYPGTVVRTDSNEPVNDSVSVDFDDGDHRQVPLACLRILPKYFTNLYELVNATGEANVASCFMTSYYTRTSNYGKDNKGVSRKHRRRLYPSGSQSTSSLTLDTASTDCSSQMDSNFVSSPNSHNNDESNQTILSNRLSDGYISDDISFTALTTLGICRSFSWQILEKLKRRKQGCIYCHSIIRDIDGLIIKIGDCVKYSSGRHEIYLGEVREIRWEKINNSPIVVAAWYYLPHEAGIDGKLVEDIKGALFATEHKDENEAKCIEQRIKVAKTYSQFLQPHSNKPKQKNRMKVKRTITDESIELPSPNQIEKDIDKVNSEAIHNIEYSTFTERHSQQSNPPTTSVHDKTISPSKDDPDTFHYFIAGKYDPVKQQVLTWDAELAKMYNLEIRTNRE
ncbi:unnamed protein product [Heterobilharzia americana]|nr:unnamed protein product [Heterobilharzia americana]